MNALNKRFSTPRLWWTMRRVAAETKAYKPIPVITDFTDENGKDCMRDMIHENYNRIKEEVKQIVKDELARIANDENLSHLLQKK